MINHKNRLRAQTARAPLGDRGAGEVRCGCTVQAAHDHGLRRQLSGSVSSRERAIANNSQSSSSLVLPCSFLKKSKKRPF